jgi:hypothetical protein
MTPEMAALMASNSVPFSPSSQQRSRTWRRQSRDGGLDDPPTGRQRYCLPARTNLTVADLGGLLDEPMVAVLAILRADGSLLSPIWHEWRDCAFNVSVEMDNVKVRHLRRDPRATIVVAESEPPLRGVELRGTARFIEEDVTENARRIARGRVGTSGSARLGGRPDRTR